jgi:hypothetical protein
MEGFARSKGRRSRIVWAGHLERSIKIQSTPFYNRSDGGKYLLHYVCLSWSVKIDFFASLTSVANGNFHTLFGNGNIIIITS